MAEEENPEDLRNKRKIVQRDRVKLTKEREKVQRKREAVYVQRTRVAETEGDGELLVALEKLQDEIDHLQKETLKLQAHSHKQQDEVNRLRRLAIGYSNEIDAMSEDLQTRSENILTMQENVQHLREDMQRQREEWNKKESKRGQKTG